MEIDKLIKPHRIYWIENNKLNYGTYNESWSALVFYYMVLSGCFDFMRLNAKIGHSWGFILSITYYKQALGILSKFLTDLNLEETVLEKLIANMLLITPQNDLVAFVHYGFVIDYDNKQVERVPCHCLVCSRPLFEPNTTGESMKEILSQLLCK